MASSAVTSRIASKQQTIGEAYGAPENFLEIDVLNPETHGVGKKRYTDYEVRMRVSCLVTTKCHSHKFVNCDLCYSGNGLPFQLVTILYLW